MGTKGDWPRPCQTTREEQDLRQLYMETDMTLEEFETEFEKLKQKGLIKRSGKVIR
jgi:hypothetical protein